ncbi:hypothetical protein [Enterobacter ludwigii]|uniref:hypothetical protein n=1 Tax=Enterobacter ludwigii TaxID=299767 RepID=UPI00041C092C|nr:hypothetical protein [Enterobacter ludwigii]
MSLQQALQFSHALLQSDDEAGLVEWLLSTFREHWQPEGIILGLCDYSGRLLECTGWHRGGYSVWRCRWLISAIRWQR